MDALLEGGFADPVMGGRYWPAVQAYWNRRYCLSSIEPSQPDGEENLDAL